MFKLLCRQNILFARKIISVVLLVTFGLSMGITSSQAQLPTLGQMVWLTPGFQPPVLRGMSVHPENPLLFDFIVDRGQDKVNDVVLKDESTKLIKYFLASMTIPDKDAWVNLSPYEKDRIVPDTLGQTEMGKIMLEQDYMLKQLSASLTNPDKDLGKKFWNEIRSRTQKQFGTTEISLSTFNKVWIVPDGATVVEKDGFAYISESKLKVMLDEDYVALQNNVQTKGDTSVQNLSTQVFREMILPQLVKEVNEGKNFAQTRQVYQSVILASWYKKVLKDSLLGRIYVNKSKIEGIESDEKNIKQKVYDQYLEAFKKGAYNVIKEENGPDGDAIPRKFFSGGLKWNPDVKVDRSNKAVSGAVIEINNAGDQLALVAASAAENKREAVAVSSSAIANKALSTLTDGTQVIYKGLKEDSKVQPVDLNPVVEELIKAAPWPDSIPVAERQVAVDLLVYKNGDIYIFLVNVADQKYIIKLKTGKLLGPELKSKLQNHAVLLDVAKKKFPDLKVPWVVLYQKKEQIEYLIMTYLPGQTLRQRIQAKVAMSLAESIKFASDLASAAQAFHSLGIKDLDLHPDNIIVGFDGTVSLFDLDVSSGDYYTQGNSYAIRSEWEVVDDITNWADVVLFSLRGQSLSENPRIDPAVIKNEALLKIILRALRLDERVLVGDTSWRARIRNVFKPQQEFKPYTSFKQVIYDLERLQESLPAKNSQPDVNFSSTVERPQEVDTNPAASSGVRINNPPTVASSSADVGGINFDPTLLNLQIKRDGRGVPLPLLQQNLENIDIKGLYPVIINIMPINTQTLPILGQLNAEPTVALSQS